MVGVLFLELLVVVAEGVEQHLLLHLLDGFAHLLLGVAHLAHHVVEHLVQFVSLAIDLVALLVGKVFVFLLRDRMPVAGRNQHQAADRALQHETVPGGLLLELLKQLLVPFLILVVDLVLLLFIFFAFEQLGDLFRELAHQLLDIVPQVATDSGRQREGRGFVWSVKIVHVTPVGRDLVLFGARLEQFLDGRGATGAGFAEDEDIEACVLHAETEFDGGQGTLLADGAFQGGELFGRGKFELSRTAMPAQLVNP